MSSRCHELLFPIARRIAKLRAKCICAADGHPRGPGGFMMSNEIAAGVRTLIESYRTAFERFDAAAIADHFVYPSHITSDGEEVAQLPLATKPDGVAPVGKDLAIHR